MHILERKKIIFKWKWIPGEVREMNFQNKYGENKLSWSHGSGNLWFDFERKKKKKEEVEKRIGRQKSLERREKCLSEIFFRQRGAGSKTLTQINLTLFKVSDSRCLCKNLHLAGLVSTCSESQISCSQTWLKFLLSLSISLSLSLSFFHLTLPSSHFSHLKSFCQRYFTNCHSQSVSLWWTVSDVRPKLIDYSKYFAQSQGLFAQYLWHLMRTQATGR